MASFSITDAATAGFSVVRRKPTALIVWAAIGLAVMIGTLAAFLLVGLDQLRSIAETVQSGTVTEPEELVALYRPLLPAYGATLVLSLIAYSVIIPAVYRAVLQPEVSSPGYVRFGMAELRQFGLIVVVLALTLGIDAGFSWILRLAMGAGGGVASAANVLGSLAIFAVLVFILVRLSLAGPDTLVKGRISLAGSWRLSKGAFWPMLAAYALMILFQIMIAAALVLFMGVMVGLGAATSGLGAAGGVLMLIFTVLWLVAACLIYALNMAVMTAPAAVIYRELSATPTPAP